MQRQCSTCDKMFTLQHNKPGLVDQCWECGIVEEGRRDVQRHVGNIGGAGINKSNAIVVERNLDEKSRRWILNNNKGKWWRNV